MVVTEEPIPTVLVIGGSGVIGQALAGHFRQQQWRVGVHYHTKATQALQFAQHLSQGKGASDTFQADIGNSEEVDRLMKRVEVTWPRLDVLVYAVGINTNKLTIQLHPEEWNRIIHTNLTGAFHCLKSIAPTFHRQGYGSVLIIGSLSGTQGTPGQTAYAASKAGLVGLVKSTAKEWGTSKIRVNGVFPGWHPSPLTGEVLSKHDYSDQVLGHSPHLTEVARLAFYLATTPGISGQIFNLDNRIA